jgi:hypothetical protein
VVVRPRYVPPPPPPPREGPPPAAQWVQIAFRSGLSFPAGNIQASDPMSNDFNLQVPFFVEAGLKVHPMLLLGVYGAISVGGVAATFANAQGCNSGGARSCGSIDFRLGLQMQLHFRPAELLNPWASYGLGFESVSASASGGGAPPGSEAYSGFEFARFGGGVDLRVSRYFGFGPFLQLDFGTYTGEHLQQPATTVDAALANTSLHEWFTLGLRGVVFP